MSKPAQQIGLLGAVAIGIASMLGAGVFSVFSAAYASAGPFLFLSLLVAGLTSSLNAASVYQLAKKHSRPGGVYSYARAEWNETASYVAGIAFLLGKVGSIAAIGLIFGEYVWPEQPKLAATLAIVTLAALNSLGINRTSFAAFVLAAITSTYLLISGLAGATHESTASPNVFDMAADSSAQGVLPAAALLFFAFAGYARVATLGDEVRDAKRNIPRAIWISLSGALFIYVLIAFALTNTLGATLQEASDSIAKMNAISLAGVPPWVTFLVASGASLGSMLALLAGISRTAATMAEDRELNIVFAKRNRFGAPWVAELAIAMGALAILFGGIYLPWIIGFSSFSVLIYYAIGHVSSYLSGKHSVGRLLVQCVGFLLCLLLVFSVPGPAVWVSTLILVAAVAIRALVWHRKER